MRTEIYIDNTLIDLTSEAEKALGLNLTFAIADIKNPDKRNSSWSKTITIPGSKNNNKKFSFIFDVSKIITGPDGINFAPDFNPNLKSDCRIYVDTLLQFNGYAQMLQINIDQERIEYEISVTGQLGNLFVEIGDTKLTDLDFSEYNHVFSKVNQISSWNGLIKKNGSDYFNFYVGLPTGEGYLYPVIDYGYDQNPIRFDVAHLFPAIYLKNYIDKIFEKAGFIYTSEFFGTTYFKSLIIPFNGDMVKLSDANKASREFNSKYAADTDYVILNQDFVNPIFPNEVSDPSNVFDNTAGVYTCNKSGTYNIEANITYDFLDGGSNTLATQIYWTLQILYPFPGGGVGADASHQHSPPPINGASYTNQNVVLKLNNVYIPKGYRAIITFWMISGTNGSTVRIKANSAFFNTAVTMPLIEGDDMELNSTIQKDVKCKDLLLSVIKLFNLYINPDPNNDKNLFIEPQSDFYAGNDVVDWTSKLDTSKQIQIKPVSEIGGKIYSFGYKEDKDFFNNDYQTIYGITYGEKDKEIQNDFVKGEVKLDLIFSPTPICGNLYNDMVIPRFIKRNDDLSVSPLPVNMRLLYYGGVKDTDDLWTYVSTTGNETFDYYPFTGHLDDPYNPTLDLLFDKPKQLYYGSAASIGTTYTDNNIYNRFYKQFIEEITDPNSKLVTAWFRLRPIDIFQLDFKNFIHVDGINYRLNKIYDYNPLVEGTTRVELSKIKNGIPFVASTTDIDHTGSNPANFSLIDGGEDEVRDPGATDVIYVLDGGLDAVINLGSYNNINIVNGGKD